MRKILSAEDEEKRRRKNQWIVGIVLIGVMFLSTLGYAFNRENSGNSENKVMEYNGFKFTSQNGYWILQKGGGIFAFKYLPNEVEKTSNKLNSIQSYSGKVLYIDTQVATTGENEITRNLGNVALRIQKACYAGSKCDSELPVKNCTDNLIILRESNTSKVLQEDNCVFIQGHLENLTIMADSFLYNILDIN